MGGRETSTLGERATISQCRRSGSYRRTVRLAKPKVKGTPRPTAPAGPHCPTGAAGIAMIAARSVCESKVQPLDNEPERF